MKILSKSLFKLLTTRAGDTALATSGFATAFAAVGFAGYMTFSNVQTPYINGMQYLAIFAQPSHPGREASTESRLDMTPVGNVTPVEKTQVNGYTLIGAGRTYAWLRMDARILAVRVGDNVPNLGHIAAIEGRGQGWVLLNEEGEVLISGSPLTGEANTGKANQKKFIFGSQP